MFGRDEKVSALRLTAAQYIILGIFLVLAYGLWRLQVMQSEYYSLAAEKNRIRNVPILAPRGKIVDREGRVIVDNSGFLSISPSSTPGTFTSPRRCNIRSTTGTRTNLRTGAAAAVTGSGS